MAIYPRALSDNLTGSPLNVINKVWHLANQNYQDTVPYATNNADVLRTIGAILYDQPALFNEFANVLVNQVGKYWMSSDLYWKNPWDFMNKGVLETGDVVQEIYVGLCVPYKYDPAVAETNWMAREVPDVHTAFHPVNYKHFYKFTIQRESLTAAFKSTTSLEQFIQQIIGQAVESAVYDQFHSFMYMLAFSIQNGLIPTVEVPDPDSVADIESCITLFRSTANKFQFKTPKFTISGVKSHTMPDKQRMIVDADFEAEAGTKVLANAFNLEYVQYGQRRTLSPGFSNMDVERLDLLFKYAHIDSTTGAVVHGDDDVAIEGYHHFSAEELAALDKVVAVLCDEDVFQCYDKLQTSVAPQENGEGLYINGWYHIWKVLGLSPFKNIVAFVATTGAISSVTMSPSTATLTDGASLQLTATVSTTGFVSQCVKWSSADTDLAVVDQNGLVTIPAEAQDDEDQTVVITATSLVNSSKTATCTITLPGTEEEE